MEPRCKYFGVCGGCENQHISYEQQLENKKQRLTYLLQNNYSGTVDVLAGEPYEYRNRMDFIIGPGKLVGFRKTNPRELVSVDECPISEPRINSLLSEVRSFVEKTPALTIYDQKKKTGVLKYAVIRAADDTSISFMLNEDGSQLTQHVELITAFAKTSTADHVVISYTPASLDDSVSLECFAVKGDGYLTSTFCGKKLTFHSQGFFQNNTTMAERMVEYVGELLKPHDMKHKTLVDAYGGVGTFGVVLAEHAKHVVSVESYPEGTVCCEKNAAQNGVTNLTAINEDAGNMKKITVPSDALFLLDPPRSGLGEKMLKYLLERKPDVIVYVSCNPSQLAKELSLLANHYTIKRAALVDLFPQTNHSEAIVLLEKKT